MENNFIQLAGTTIDPASIHIPKAADFFSAVQESEFCQIQQVLVDEHNRTIIVFDTQVEVPQFPKFDIRKVERVAVAFEKSDNDIQKVYALRDDFPTLIHQLLEDYETPKSLCLYNIPYEEIKLFWTGFTLLQRIREWLKYSAIGELHQKDQPLEPLMTGEEGVILIPYGISEKSSVFVYNVSSDYYKRETLFASLEEVKLGRRELPVQFEYLQGKPQMHGTLVRKPQTLDDLHSLLSRVGLNLQEFIVEKLRHYQSAKIDLKRKLMLYVDLPKLRDDADTNYVFENFVFITRESIETMGQRLNLWDVETGGIGLGILINQPIRNEGFKELALGVLKPVFPLTSELAATLNHVPLALNLLKMVAVGVGALGSELVMNLIRAGIGEWTCIDSDIVYPHNLARCAYMGYDVMHKKVECFSNHGNSIMPGIVNPVFADLIKDATKPEVKDRLEEAEVILDLSASTAAARKLSEFKNIGRICSCFVNPKGSDLVMIGEDGDKQYSLEALEIQYLRFIWNTPELHDHFERDEKIRYSTGCRDLSLVLPQDSIALASGIASKAIKQYVTNNGPLISIWRTDSDELTVQKYTIIAHKINRLTLDGWSIIYDELLMTRIYAARQSRLPNETGGVLIGSYDMERKVVFVADVIHSPVDSVEYPTAYIRGIKGIGEKLIKIGKVTAGGLQYVGEWHSHPDGCSVRMSDDDATLFGWLTDNMHREGLPALMMIAGEKQQFSFFVSGSK